MTGEELPRLAGLEGFELWDRTTQAPAHAPVKNAFVSVRVGGVIGMNRAAHKMWGSRTPARSCTTLSAGASHCGR